MVELGLDGKWEIIRSTAVENEAGKEGGGG